ncbi:MAG: ACT domain-containing protein [Nanoarchaeota archaeon]|nr:ACT domain-containing protein [Nanoarchaeota archaeon]
MRQFEISVANKIGCLATVTDVLAQSRVNIKAIATDTKESGGVIKIVTDDEEVTRDALKDAGLEFREHEIVLVHLLDKPGEIAKVARAMSNLNINIESVFLMDRDQGTAHVAFKVDDLIKAKELLK